jgi:hypothetical protein
MLRCSAKGLIAVRLRLKAMFSDNPLQQQQHWYHTNQGRWYYPKGGFSVNVLQSRRVTVSTCVMHRCRPCCATKTTSSSANPTVWRLLL